jgi:hypothetical protein
VRRLYADVNAHDAAASAGAYAVNALNHGAAAGREGMRLVFESLLATRSQ